MAVVTSSLRQFTAVATTIVATTVVGRTNGHTVAEMSQSTTTRSTTVVTVELSSCLLGKTPTEIGVEFKDSRLTIQLKVPNTRVLRKHLTPLQQAMGMME